MRGRFITLEGGEGAGKSTQARLLVDALHLRLNSTTMLTREPGGSTGAELLRDLLLSCPIDWAPQAETLLHFAARAEHVEKMILPTLESGDWVVCDRFYDSTMAYQGYGQGDDREAISSLIKQVRVHPDITFVLDVTPHVATRRLQQRGTGAGRYERLGADFHASVNQGYRAIAHSAPERCVLVNADSDKATVHALIMAEVIRRFG
jgi:dTMP kinase